MKNENEYKVIKRRSDEVKRTENMYVEKDGKQYQIMLFYDMGGYNYWTYKHDPRGYFLSIRPVTLTLGKDDKILWVEFTMFAGRRLFLEEAKRFSKKRLSELVEYHFDIDNQEIKRLLEIVIEVEKEKHA